MIGRVESVTLCNGHIYAAGFEIDYEGRQIATLWIDGVPEHYLSGWECSSSHAIEIHSYGDDVYMLTSEYNGDMDKYRTFLWMNGTVIQSYDDLSAAGFTIL